MIDVPRFNPTIDLKHIRAHVIRDYIYPNDKVVCFSCGNASKALKDVNELDVLDIGEYGDLKPNHWFTQKEIADIFPNRFDATCGHLNMELMNELASTYHNIFQYYVEGHEAFWLPTGSGETLICLKMAFPDILFHAVYNIDAATKYEENAPLNMLVKQMAFTIINSKEELKLWQI